MNDLKNLCVHIGLPKTGTTSLQNNIFSNLSNTYYIGRNNSNKLIYKFSQFFRTPGLDINLDLNNFNIKGKTSIFISDENISMTPMCPFKKTGVYPEVIAVNICRIGELLGANVTRRIIITIRRQDTWLASRYAESAKLMTAPNQKYFENWVSSLLSDRATSLRKRWLTYSKMFKLFKSCFGAQNCKFIPLERYAEDSFKVEQELYNFITNTPESNSHKSNNDEAYQTNKNEYLNKLASDDNKWHLKKHESKSIELTKEISSAVLKYFQKDNILFANEVGIDLSKYGYY